MIIPDTNLLTHAYRADSADHAAGRRWWVECLSGKEPVGLCTVVIFGFVRVMTNPRLFANPLSTHEAGDRVDAWLQHEVVEILEMEPGDVKRALDLLKEAGTAGNLTSDAQIAALALRHHGVVHSADVDFARFAGVRWYNPLTGRSSR